MYFDLTVYYRDPIVRISFNIVLKYYLAFLTTSVKYLASNIYQISPLFGGRDSVCKQKRVYLTRVTTEL